MFYIADSDGEDGTPVQKKGRLDIVVHSNDQRQLQQQQQQKKQQEPKRRQLWAVGSPTDLSQQQVRRLSYAEAVKRGAVKVPQPKAPSATLAKKTQGTPKKVPKKKNETGQKPFTKADHGDRSVSLSTFKANEANNNDNKDEKSLIKGRKETFCSLIVSSSL
jgi:hypothetical protein